MDLITSWMSCWTHKGNVKGDFIGIFTQDSVAGNKPGAPVHFIQALND